MMAFMIFLTFFAMLAYVFFLWFQTYTLVIEAVLQFIAMTFAFVELVLGAVLLITF